MSTRAQIIIKNQYDELWFYRHSDGYPSGVLPSLTQFMDWLIEGKIRNSVEQSAGWLIIIGHREYVDSMPDYYSEIPGKSKMPGMGDWKVGAYEPSVPTMHGDIEYLYTIDLDKKTLTYQTIHYSGEHYEKQTKGKPINLYPVTDMGALA